MKKIINILILLFCLHGTSQKIVTTTGSASNNGDSEADAWSIEHAFNTAQAGDVVYIKSGVYSDVIITQTNNGTSTNPITFIGYDNTFGDIVTGDSSVYTYGDPINGTDIPLLRENRNANGIGEGIAITIDGNYVNLKNIEIQYYDVGLRVNGDNGEFDNIITHEQGNFDPSLTSPPNPDAFLNYAGRGMQLFGDNNKFNNLYAENAGAECITLRGDNNTFNNTQVHADNTVNPTDYYFLLASANDNLIENTLIWRHGSLEHYGHGIVFKESDPTANNIVDGFEIINTNLELQFPGVYDNTLRNGSITKLSDGGSSDGIAGINMANGSHDNHYDNIVVENGNIKFADWDDGLSGDVDLSSYNNTFNQLVVVPQLFAVGFYYFGNNNYSSPANNNKFYNCTFYKGYGSWLFERSRANSGTEFVNCIFSGFTTYGNPRSSSPGYDVVATWTSTNLYNSSQASIDGVQTNVTTVDPQFVDPTNRDFSLEIGSPLIGQGVATPFLAAGNNIGAIQNDQSTQNYYYVATNGSSSNTGQSTASPWSLSYAEDKLNDGTIPLGSTVWIKAGNYGSLNLIFTRSGTSSSTIKVKGYKNTIGDLDTTDEPRFSYGDTFSSSDMPTITNSGNGSSGVGVWMRGNYSWLENFQIIGYKENLNSYSITGATLKNVTTYEGGIQESNIAGGRGIIARGSNWLIENCFDFNSTGQGITLQDSNNSIIRNSKVYNDNLINPGGYFFLIAASSYTNLVEGCTIYRDVNATIHGGHGAVIKDLAENNTFRDITIYNTGVEVNFSGVKNNLYEDIRIYGGESIATNPNNSIRVGSGASNNTFRNFYMEDVRYAMEFRNNNDGPAPTSPSTNADSGGNDNLFENIIVNKARRLIHTSNYQNGITTVTTGNKFNNITAYDIYDSDFMTAYHTNMSGWEFKNISISNASGNRLIALGTTNFSLDIDNSNFYNNGFSAPSGTNITTSNPLFVNASGGNFNLQSSSPLIDNGTAISGLTFDYNNDLRVVNGTIDIGAIEYQGVGGGEDTTAPVITEVTETLITETSIQVEFRFDEGSTGRIEYGTTTGYGSYTTLETNYLTFHRQNITGLTPNTLYYYRILGEDSSGNDVTGSQRSATTLDDGEDTEQPVLGSIKDLRGLFLKRKKM